tara:strand:- start:2193 stop:2915 length:723 start_codon:yes stop_codon:yes gene_type:complete
MDILAIVQARMGSTRLPGKVLKKVCNLPLIQILFERLNQSEKINKIICATTTNREDDLLEKVISKIGFDVFRGSEKDVLRRYYEVAKMYNAKNIVRITGDCPFVDPNIVDEVINLFIKTNSDYCSNVIPPTFPDGLDVEIFNISTLEKTYLNAISPKHREHVTTYMIEDQSLQKANFFHSVDHSEKRWTLDYEEDFEIINNVFNYFHPNIHFKIDDILKLQITNPKIFLNNNHISRNERI